VSGVEVDGPLDEAQPEHRGVEVHGSYVVESVRCDRVNHRSSLPARDYFRPFTRLRRDACLKAVAVVRP
jgi:hypothetical protein